MLHPANRRNRYGAGIPCNRYCRYAAFRSCLHRRRKRHRPRQLHQPRDSAVLDPRWKHCRTSRSWAPGCHSEAQVERQVRRRSPVVLSKDAGLPPAIVLRDGIVDVDVIRTAGKQAGNAVAGVSWIGDGLPASEKRPIEAGLGCRESEFASETARLFSCSRRTSPPKVKVWAPRIMVRLSFSSSGSRWRLRARLRLPMLLLAPLVPISGYGLLAPRAGSPCRPSDAARPGRESRSGPVVIAQIPDSQVV